MSGIVIFSLAVMCAAFLVLADTVSRFAKVSAALHGRAKPNRTDYLFGCAGLMLGLVGVQLVYALHTGNHD